MSRWKSDREDEFLLLKVLLAFLAVVVATAGLIEWNARRQAAAMTRELLRAPTPAEQAQIERYQRQADLEMARLRRAVRAQSRSAKPAKRVDARALAPGERCIEGQRFRAIENGWQQIGTCR